MLHKKMNNFIINIVQLGLCIFRSGHYFYFFLVKLFYFYSFIFMFFSFYNEIQIYIYLLMCEMSNIIPQSYYLILIY